MSAAELGRRAGIASNTIRKWAALTDDPLPSTPGPDGQRSYTVAQLRAFCASHPHGVAARRALRRLDAVSPHAATTDSPVGEQAGALLNLRIAAQAALEVATTAARQAEQNAASHREQVEALALMIRSYDDLLTSLTAPTTLDD